MFSDDEDGGDEPPQYGEDRRVDGQLESGSHVLGLVKELCAWMPKAIRKPVSIAVLPVVLVWVASIFFKGYPFDWLPGPPRPPVAALADAGDSDRRVSSMTVVVERNTTSISLSGDGPKKLSIRVESFGKEAPEEVPGGAVVMHNKSD